MIIYCYRIPVDKITIFLDAIDPGEEIRLKYSIKENCYVIHCNIAPEEFDAIKELEGII